MPRLGARAAFSAAVFYCRKGESVQSVKLYARRAFSLKKGGLRAIKACFACKNVFFAACEPKKIKLRIYARNRRLFIGKLLKIGV